VIFKVPVTEILRTLYFVARYYRTQLQVGTTECSRIIIWHTNRHGTTHEGAHTPPFRRTASWKSVKNIAQSFWQTNLAKTARVFNCYGLHARMMETTKTFERKLVAESICGWPHCRRHGTVDDVDNVRAQRPLTSRLLRLVAGRRSIDALNWWMKRAPGLGRGEGDGRSPEHVCIWRIVFTDQSTSSAADVSWTHTSFKHATAACAQQLIQIYNDCLGISH